METIEQLRTRLRIIRRDRAELNLSADEQKYFDLKEFKLEAQIEAREFSNAIHSAFRMCRFWNKDGELKSLYEWEQIKADTLAAIQLHEIQLLNRIDLKISKYHEYDNNRLPDLPHTEASTQ